MVDETMMTKAVGYFETSARLHCVISEKINSFLLLNFIYITHRNTTYLPDNVNILCRSKQIYVGRSSSKVS